MTSNDAELSKARNEQERVCNQIENLKIEIENRDKLIEEKCQQMSHLTAELVKTREEREAESVFMKRQIENLEAEKEQLKESLMKEKATFNQTQNSLYSRIKELEKAEKDLTLQLQIARKDILKFKEQNEVKPKTLKIIKN